MKDDKRGELNYSVKSDIFDRAVDAMKRWQERAVIAEATIAELRRERDEARRSTGRLGAILLAGSWRDTPLQTYTTPPTNALRRGRR